MPRIRSLKYEYFINEDLAQTSVEARLLGLGLTTLADREGRMEDRPQRIKVLLFPYHDVDIEKSLTELETAGFLARYTVDDKHYIRIVNFLKHQKPHPRETPSVIPCHVKARPRRAKVSPTVQTPAEQVESSRRNGLGDLGTSVNGSGGGLGDHGNGDSAKAGASAAKPETGQGEFTIWKLAVGKFFSVGMDEQAARSFLGAQCKTFGKDAVAAAVTKMLAQEPADPKTYLVAILQGQNGTRRGMSKVDHSMENARKVIEEIEHGS